MSAETERPGPAPVGERIAVRSPLTIAVFLGLVTASVAGDLASKHFVFDSILNDPATVRRISELRESIEDGEQAPRKLLRQVKPRRLLPGVKITLSTNPGVVFGLPMPRWAVASATLITLALVFYFFAVAPIGARLLQAALALILGGALGNLYDRLFGEVRLPGMGLMPIRYEVRDFIDCSELYYPWIFNVADMLLVVGAALLLVHWMIISRRERTGRNA